MNERTQRVVEPNPTVAEMAAKLTTLRVADVDEGSVWNEEIELDSDNGPAEPAELGSTPEHND